MNYEDLYVRYQNLEKTLKDKTKLVTRLQKAISKEMEAGELVKCINDTAQMRQASEEVTSLLEEIEALVTSFDQTGYIESGDFAEQFVGESVILQRVLHVACVRQQFGGVGGFANGFF